MHGAGNAKVLLLGAHAQQRDGIANADELQEEARKEGEALGRAISTKQTNTHQRAPSLTADPAQYCWYTSARRPDIENERSMAV